MGKRKKAEDTNAVLFKRLYGVKREYDSLHQKGGKPPKLTVEVSCIVP